jgi:hypothetical protein
VPSTAFSAVAFKLRLKEEKKPPCFFGGLVLVVAAAVCGGHPDAEAREPAAPLPEPDLADAVLGLAGVAGAGAADVGAGAVFGAEGAEAGAEETLEGSSIALIILSDTPAFCSRTKSSGVSL